MALLTPDKSLRFAIEVIFVLLGGLVFWIGHSGHFPYSFNPHGMGWLLLSIADPSPILDINGNRIKIREVA